MPISDRDLRIPLGALVILPQNEWELYLSQLNNLPQGLRSLVTSPRAGYFLVGLLKTHDIAPERLPIALLTVLRVAFAEIALTQLPTVLATELQMPLDKAQRVATEIEKELFSAVLLELNRYREEKQRGVQNLPRTQSPQQSMAAAPSSPPAPPRPLDKVQGKPFDQPQYKPLQPFDKASPFAKATGDKQGKPPAPRPALPNVLDLKNKLPQSFDKASPFAKATGDKQGKPFDNTQDKPPVPRQS